MYDQQVTLLLNHFRVPLHINQDTSPISLTKIISKFDIKLRHLEFDDSISGMYVKTSKGKYIVINSRHHYRRRRFSLGHEFGHFCLNHPGDVSSLLKDDEQRIIERQANSFSACILMPYDLVHKFSKQKHMSIPKIADWFRVSTIAAAIRFKILGYRIDEAESLISDYWNEQGDPDWDVACGEVTVSQYIR